MIWANAFRIATRTEGVETDGHRRLATGGLRRVRDAFASVFGRISERRRLARSRQALLHLDDRLLDDIGLDRHVALREARRSAWSGRQTRWW
jgi:uncharacterized protein YjiS (DUF1127 family)